MKTLIYALAFALVLLGISTPGLTTASHPELPARQIDSSRSDLGYHMAAASHYEQELKPLKQKIRRLVQRAQTYNRKPYLDPKGLRRDAIQRQLGNLLRDLSELRQNIALHRELANQLMEAKK